MSPRRDIIWIFEAEASNSAKMGSEPEDNAMVMETKEFPPMPPKAELNKAIWNQLCSLNQKMDAIHIDNAEVRNDLYESEGLVERITGTEARSETNSTDISTIQTENKELRYELSVIKSLVLKQNDQLDQLQEKLTDQTFRSMRNNILVHNVAEQDRENCLKLVQTILKEKLGLDGVNIENAHRVGPKTQNPNHIRLLVARLLHRQDTYNVLDLAKKLPKGAKLLKITPQHPPEMLGKRRELAQVAAAVREQHPQVKTTLARDKLFINNELYREPLPTPKARDILGMTRADRAELQKLPVIEGKIVSDMANILSASAAQVHSLDKARAAYKKVLCHPAKLAATSTAAVLRLYSPVTTKTTEYCQDDKDDGAARLILQHVRETRPRAHNIMIFLTWKRLRPTPWRQRCQLIREAVDSVLDIAEASQWI